MLPVELFLQVIHHLLNEINVLQGSCKEKKREYCSIWAQSWEKASLHLKFAELNFQVEMCVHLENIQLLLRIFTFEYGVYYSNHMSYTWILESTNQETASVLSNHICNSNELLWLYNLFMFVWYFWNACTVVNFQPKGCFLLTLIDRRHTFSVLPTWYSILRTNTWSRCMLKLWNTILCPACSTHDKERSST